MNFVPDSASNMVAMNRMVMRMGHSYSYCYRIVTQQEQTQLT